MTVSACRNWTVPASRSRSAHSRPHSSPLRAPVAAASTVQVPSYGLVVWSAASSSTVTCSGANATASMRGTGGGVALVAALWVIVAAAGQGVGQSGLGLAAGGVAAQGLESAPALGAAGQLEAGAPGSNPR